MPALPHPRILYHRWKPLTALATARDACVLQDCVRFADGSYLMYEISVQHRYVIF